MKSDYEVLDLEYSCQILSDKIKGTQLLLKLYHAIRNEGKKGHALLIRYLDIFAISVLICRSICQNGSSYNSVQSFGMRQ